ncbi:MAG: polysaccharide biosynthesis C-terminal domain-containing protein, partial [Halobacteriaceae archaeon]
IPLLFGTVVVGDLVFEVVYGFQTGYLTFVVLTVGFVFFSLTNPIHQSLYGIDSPRFAFYTSLSTTAVNVSLALVLVPQFDILGAASSTAAA